MDTLFEECFSHCRHDDDCRECEFFASCACLSAPESRADHHLGMVSFESLDGWSRYAATSDTPGEPEEPEESPELPVELLPLAEFCRYIFSLDDYTLGILAEIIVPGNGAERSCSVADLARLHRCSRQAIHRKMLSSVRRHPELAEVFRLTLRKIGRSRAYFHRPEAAHARS